MDPGSTTDLLAVALTLGRGQTLTQGTWSKTPGKLWKVGGTAEEGARENPAFPPFLHLAAASIRRCCTCVPGVSDQMQRVARGEDRHPAHQRLARLLPGVLEAPAVLHGRERGLHAPPLGVARDDLGRGQVRVGADQQALLARPVAPLQPHPY